MAFTHYKKATIDHTQCGSSDSSNFPVTIFIADADFATVAHGGKTQNANGYDIRPFSDVGLSSALTYELVPGTYNATTGTLEMHVKVPTLSASVDGAIYLATGDTSLSTDGSSTATWSNSFALVYHFADGTTLSAADATGNTAAGTINGSTAAASGVIDGDAVFGVSGSDAIVTGLTTHSTTRTYEGWLRRSGDGGGFLGRWFDKRTSGATVELAYYDTNPGVNNLVFDRFFSGGENFWVLTAPLPLNEWHHVVITYDSSSATNDPIFYLDGASSAFTPNIGGSGTANTSTEAYVVGNRTNDNARVWVGTQDELRISNTIRSADWVTATYNNQKTASTFLSWGSLTQVGKRFLLIPG